MSQRACSSRGKSETISLPPSYLRALKAFHTYTERMKVTPDQASLGAEMGKSKSTARQALEYLTNRKVIRHTGVSTRPWVITPLGEKVIQQTKGTVSA